MAKQAKFRRGLSEELKDKLSIVDFPDFQALVDKAIVAEHAARELMDSRKRKWETYKSSKSSSSRPRFGQSQGFQSQFSAPPRSPAPVPRSSQAVPQSRAPASQQSGSRNPAASVTCFACNQKGHYANQCPKKTGAAPRPNGGRGPGGGSSQDQKIVPATQGVGSGRVNVITAEEAQEAPDVVLGTLFVNSHPATVLFDSGASHSFVSESFAAVGELLFSPLSVPLLIRSPGSELRAELECRDVPIEIEGVGFSANLILLKSASLDVILGMDWLSRHMGQIDCAKKSVSLSSPFGVRVSFSPKLLGPHLFALEAKSVLDINEVPT
ncbi:MAG: hypothetical protein ACRC4N_14545, partial [Gammaproteobacteria bacterium]